MIRPRHVMIVTIIACLSFAASAQRRVPPTTLKKHIVTKSGDAEMILPTGLADSRARLAGLCEKIGWTLRRQNDPMVLVCDVPSTERTAAPTPGTYDLQTLVERNSGTVPVPKQVDFHLVAARGGTVVRARGMRVYPSISGSAPVREYMRDENTFNGLINIMALIGGTFAPGTTFRNVGYIGFRSDQVVDRATPTGSKRVGIVIGAIDAASPGAEAGLKVGDVIHRINDRDFGDYEGAAKLLAKLRPGNPVVLQIERDAQPLSVALVAGSPMAVR